MKKIIIIGASSGIGRQIALDFANMGWQVGIAARRDDRLAEIKALAPNNIEYIAIDVTANDATERFRQLIDKLGGMDCLLYCAGCGWRNPQLDESKDRRTVDVNVVGFTAIINAAYLYYKEKGRGAQGQICAISSIAGTKGIGISATYSATKRYQWTYLQAIEQLAHTQGVQVSVTDIRPGFVDTELLAPGEKYPFEMTVAEVAPLIEKAILRKKRVVVVNKKWQLITAFWEMIPSCIWRLVKIEKTK